MERIDKNILSFKEIDNNVLFHNICNGFGHLDNLALEIIIHICIEAGKIKKFAKEKDRLSDLKLQFLVKFITQSINITFCSRNINSLIHSIKTNISFFEIFVEELKSSEKTSEMSIRYSVENLIIELRNLLNNLKETE